MLIPVWWSLTDGDLVYGITAMWHKQLERLFRMTLRTEVRIKPVKKATKKADALCSHNLKLTFAAALHISATILPDTRVSKMLVVAKLNTFSRATCSKNVAWVLSVQSKVEESGGIKVFEVLTLKMSKEHCVRMVLKVEDSPSSTKLSKWVIFSVSVSSRVCSRVLLSIRAKHLWRYKKHPELKCEVTVNGCF